MRVVAINNGYYFMKSTKGLMFRSTYRDAYFGEYGNGCDVVSLDKKNFFVVGDGAICIEKDKTSSVATKLFVLTMLAKHMGDTSSENFKVYLTAPPLTYGGQRESLPSYLTGKYEFVFNGVVKNIEISEVIVFPETIMAYISNISNRLLDSSRPTLVMDIGGYTTNMAYIVNGNYNKDSLVSFANGMYHIEEAVREYLSATYLNLNFDKVSMQDFFKRGLKDEVRKVNILDAERETITKIFNDYIGKAFDKATLKGWSPALCDILVTGGGGKVLYKAIRDKYSHALLSEDPIFDNLKGMQQLISRELLKGEASVVGAR